jgi:hypothetical protein
MEYNHIKDCWAAIREAKTIEEVKNLFEQFPRWSGDWNIEIEDNQYVVYNTYFDEQCDSFDTDYETLDIEVEVEVDDDIELEDHIPTYQVWGFWLDEEQQVLTEVMLHSSDLPEEALKYAESFTDTLRKNNALELDEDVKYYEVMVETVVDFGEYTENVGTLYRETIEM